MQYTYRNFDIDLTLSDGSYTFSATFGDTEIFDQPTGTDNLSTARSMAESVVDSFIECLPPALSYKNYNDEDY